MSIEKTLQKIKIQIGDISETLQSFAEDTIHPAVADCDKLRAQMNDLQEQLAVYKYFKLNAEISPSFNLHAKVSEKVAAIEDVKLNVVPEKVAPTPAPEPVAAPSVKEAEVAQAPTVEPVKPIAKEQQKQLQPLAIGINDKFRFINELFSQNSSEYNIVLEQINNLQSWQETDLYLSSLKNVYGWKDSNESVIYFLNLIRKRFE
jgi:hypothetical protein